MSHFKFNDGTTATNLSELLDSLKRIDDAVFRHHVNEQKNDFSNWIRDVLKENELAEDIFLLRTKEEIIKRIESETDYGKKALDHFIKSNKELLLALQSFIDNKIENIEEKLRKIREK